MTRRYEAPVPPETAADLLAYADRQATVQHLRRRTAPDFPWPDAYNPMLKYLVEQAVHIADTEGRDTALVWLAVHAWFEGALDSASGLRQADDEPELFPRSSHSG